MNDFTARENYSLRNLPRLLTEGCLTKQSFWPKVKDLMSQIIEGHQFHDYSHYAHDDGLELIYTIPDYLYDSFVKKLIERHGPIMDGYDENGNQIRDDEDRGPPHPDSDWR